MRQTRIQQYCESIIEAGWLAALIIAPLFFNTYSSRVFEPDKISLIRSISLVMLLAYLVKVLDRGRIWLPAGGQPPSPASRPPAGNDDNHSGLDWALGRLWKAPLLLPVLLLAVSYMLSTLLSISPSVSWWGSYHRLQGAYTFFSYLVIALLAAAHLRQPSQLRRLQHTVIMTSLPISLYGIFQHFGKDPLPWGKDVDGRITANAGNPIFLSAHLIMAFFLTLERAVSSYTFLLTSGPQSNAGPAPDEDAEGPTPEQSLAGVLAGGSYLFILIVQLLAIYWSQSRGPWLGLASGLYVFVLLLLTGLRPRNYRSWTAAWVGLGIAGFILLILLNTTALGNALRPVPTWGRLTTMLDSATGTGRVRVLIWEGTAELISPNPPLTLPDGSKDPVNALRPLIGYGPETLWMAFNRFYPPELAQWESRSASPDRAHNETWDSLAMTGILGFLANSLLFLSIFFWALRWLGLIRSRRDVALFASMVIGCGLLLSLLFQLRGVSVGFLGVNWPTGLVLGLIAYVTLAVFLLPESTTSPAQRRRQLLLVAAFSAIIAHFVEIHFGIAVAATRIYFWVFAALMLGVGMNWLTPEPFAAGAAVPDRETQGGAGASNAGSRRASSRAKGARGRRRSIPAVTSWRTRLPATFPTDILILFTLAFLYTVNFRGLSNPLSVLFLGLGGASQNANGAGTSDILWLVLFTWLIATGLGAATALIRLPTLQPAARSTATRSQAAGRNVSSGSSRELGMLVQVASAAGLYGLVLFAAWLIYGVIHASRLLPGARSGSVAEQLDQIAGHYGLFAWLVVSWCLLTGLVLALRAPAPARQTWLGRGVATVGAAAVFAVFGFFIIGNVNIAQVRADVFYKQGQTFDAAARWVQSADLYRRALAVRPTEDHYMLYLGRSLLESAAQAPPEGSLPLPAEPSIDDILNLSTENIELLGQNDVWQAARTVLLRAQEVNPLNTDHTANLARLYRYQSQLTNDNDERNQALETSLEYYDAALTLSPKAAHLWNEKGQIQLTLGRSEEAEQSFLHSLTLDDRFENTYLLLAEVHRQNSQPENMIRILDQGLEKLPDSLQLLNHKGSALSQAGDLEGALETITRVYNRSPEDLDSIRNLIILTRLLDRNDEALQWADLAKGLIETGRGGQEEAVSIYRMLVEINLDLGRLPESVDFLHRLMDLAPNDFRYPFQLAQIHLQLGNSQFARQFGENALALAPDSDKPPIQSFVDSIE